MRPVSMATWLYIAPYGELHIHDAGLSQLDDWLNQFSSVNVSCYHCFVIRTGFIRFSIQICHALERFADNRCLTTCWVPFAWFQPANTTALSKSVRCRWSLILSGSFQTDYPGDLDVDAAIILRLSLGLEHTQRHRSYDVRTVHVASNSRI
jgi:hypothetical protein